MGVNGLFQFLKRFRKEVHIPSYLNDKTVAIDIFWFLHQSKGDIFTLQNYLFPIILNAKQVYCVFDGTAPPDKRQELEERAKKRREIQKTIDAIEEFLKNPFNILTSENKHCIIAYLNELKFQVWIPSSNYILSVKEWLNSRNIIVCQSENEADDDLYKLQKYNIVDVVITNDSDLFILGATNIMRVLSPIRAEVYNKYDICKKINFTVNQWSDFMYLCKNMKEKDILLAYSLISVYKDLENIHHKYSTIHNSELIME
jgi:5'-3' exonuclease